MQAQTGADPAGASGTDASAKARQAAEQAQEKAQAAAEQAQEKAQAAAGQAQVKLREQLDQRSGQLAEQVDRQAADLRSVGETLREQGKDPHARVVDRLAGYAEQAGGYLRESDAETILGDVEEFGRRRPGAVAAGAFVLGLAASRFLKASSGRRYTARQTRTTLEPPASAPGTPVDGGPVTPPPLRSGSPTPRAGV